MSPIIISLIGAWLITHQPQLGPELLTVHFTNFVVLEIPKQTVTLEIPTSRPYILLDSVALFKFTDSEWEILTNTFSEHVIRHATNGVYSFSSTNQWSKDHPWKSHQDPK